MILAAIKAWLPRRDSGFFFLLSKVFWKILDFVALFAPFRWLPIEGDFYFGSDWCEVAIEIFLKNFRISAKNAPFRRLPIERENKKAEIFSKTLPFLCLLVGYYLRGITLAQLDTKLIFVPLTYQKVHRVTTRELPGAERKGGKLLLSRSVFRVNKRYQSLVPKSARRVVRHS